MRFFDKRSLKWQLMSKIIIAQSLILALIMCFNFSVFGLLWYFGYVNNGNSDMVAAEAISRAIRTNQSGSIYVVNSPELQRLHLENPDFWYIIRDSKGNLIEEGQAPKQILVVLTSQVLDAIAYADVGQDGNKSELALATIQWQESQAGWVKIATGARSKVSFYEVLKSGQTIFLLLFILIIPIIVAILIVIPYVIRRVFKGLDHVTSETTKIDINSSGIRLDTNSVPLEILPFVNAVNDTLTRLDHGYEVHKRFLVDAAHELRTPIAILTTRLSALPSGALKNRLLEDSARLTSLAGQLLDLQRLDKENICFVPVDLVMLAEQVVSDLAPLAFGAGYELCFEVDEISVMVDADQMAIERALTNLIQNAMSYGGRQGVITIRVSKSKWIEVSDEGVGIPENAIENIFEPFHRLKQDGNGVGLGLDLVKKIMQLHGGNVQIIPMETKGACFRLTFL